VAAISAIECLVMGEFDEYTCGFPTTGDGLARMRFTLIDRITTLDPGKSITAVKNLALSEEYLADHFPGFPVMPGVLMVEAMVQAGAWFMRHEDDFAFSMVVLKAARAIKFVNFVLPGRTLHVTAELTSSTARECTFKGSGTVDGESMVSAKLTLERFNLAERNPRLAEADEAQKQAARELFRQLWRETPVPPA
jgi:3-hydroxyacyl-[acyl-carrier-protein] dehydratase